MTAREAHTRSVGTEEDYIKLLIDVYNFIHEEVNDRNTSIDYWIDSLYLADRVFNELVKQGYNVNLEKDMGADKVWHLSIDQWMIPILWLPMVAKKHMLINMMMGIGI